MTNLELRIASELRAAGPGQIAGYAAVFNQPTQIRDYTEVIAPGTFARAIKTRQDVRLLLNHDADNILARTKSGTLSLAEDSHGLAFTADLAPTQLGRDVRKLIERGDLSQCSFAFRCVKDSWPEFDQRVIEDVDLFDCSIVAFPAYAQTSVVANSKQLAAELRASGRGNFATIGFYDCRRDRISQGEAQAITERLRRELLAPDAEIQRLRLKYRFLRTQP